MDERPFIARRAGSGWKDRAQCIKTREPIDTFFDDIWRSSGGSNIAALHRARTICAGCEARTPCAQEVLDDEAGTSKYLRFGLRAGLTPEQRHSIEKRGGLKGKDPLTYVTDWRRSDTVPVPDRGDGWTERHTKLVARVIAEVLDVLDLYSALPSVSTMAAELHVRENDLRRVLRALAEDGNLEVTGDRRGWYRYVAPFAHRVGWQPQHIRSNEGESL